jgi:hypothetical protein
MGVRVLPAATLVAGIYDEEEWDMSKVIGALWIRESREGRKYYSGQLDLGVLGNVQIAIFKNDRRQHDRSPEYNIVLSGPVPPPPLPPPETIDVQEGEPNDEIPF